jgi:multidrug efflux pump subunit AcrB
VFAPAFSMNGIPGSLFLPLALAIAFAMITSYTLAQTFVPVLANWLMKEEHGNGKNKKTDEQIFKESGISPTSETDTFAQRELYIEEEAKKKTGFFDKIRSRSNKFLIWMMPFRVPIVLLYIIGSLAIVFLLVKNIGRDVLPRSNAGQFQVRLHAPDGTRIEQTELITLKAIDVLDSLVGKKNVEITSAMVGMHGSQYSTNPIYLFMPGSEEAVLQAALKEGFKINMDDLKDGFRKKMKEDLPDVHLSFEPIELTDKILSQGSPTPIEIKILSKNKPQNEEYAYKIIDALKHISYLRDIQIRQAIKYPAINIDIDRIKAAQLGVTPDQISRSLTATTSSSRFTEKNSWIDQKQNLSYFVQVQVPENKMTSVNDIGETPILPNSSRPVLSDVATITQTTMYGENDDIGATPTLSVTANLYKKDLGTATTDVNEAIKKIGTLPRGLFIETRGLSPVLTDTLDNLQSGLLVAVIVIFLMLAANFQSFKVSLVVLCTAPAVLVGSLILLLLTNSTLNLQSYMGIIMSVGVYI